MGCRSHSTSGGLTLYSTLEPCLLCTAAIWQCRIPRVRFAARDPFWESLDQVPGLNSGWAPRCPEREGPLPGRLAAWAAALPADWSLHRTPAETATRSSYRFLTPGLVELAEQLHLDLRVSVVEAWVAISPAIR